MIDYIYSFYKENQLPLILGNIKLENFYRKEKCLLIGVKYN